MCIIEDLLQVSHSKDAENYYHSVEDAKSESLYKGISIGEKRGRTLGREEAYQEMAKIFHIPYEVILEKTKQESKQMRK